MDEKFIQTHFRFLKQLYNKRYNSLFLLKLQIQLKKFKLFGIRFPIE